MGGEEQRGSRQWTWRREQRRERSERAGSSGNLPVARISLVVSVLLHDCPARNNINVKIYKVFLHDL